MAFQPNWHSSLRRTMSTYPVAVGATVGLLGWLTGYWGAQTLLSGTSSVGACSMVAGWFMSAYCSAKFKVPVRTAALMFLAHFLVFLCARIAGSALIYRDAWSISLGGTIVVGILQAAIFASPVVINFLVDLTIRSISADAKRG